MDNNRSDVRIDVDHRRSGRTTSEARYCILFYALLQTLTFFARLCLVLQVLRLLTCSRDCLRTGQSWQLSTKGTRRARANAVVVTCPLQRMHVHRERSGLGQKVEASLMESQLAALVNIASNCLIGGVTQTKRYGTSHPSIVPYQAFDCSDGQMVVCAGNDRQVCVILRMTDSCDVGG